jgi:CheY-like chemotaxis protein
LHITLSNQGKATFVTDNLAQKFLTPKRMKRILLIDDDKICTFLCSKTLERMGIAEEIHIAANGKEGIDLLNAHFRNSGTLPDIILLDLSMPVMDGFGFLEAFNTLSLVNKELIKIIIVTSSANPGDMNKARGMGVEHYLIKPISEEKLKAILEEPARAAETHYTEGKFTREADQESRQRKR